MVQGTVRGGILLLLLCAFAVLGLVCTAQAETVIQVTLEDASDPGVNGMKMSARPNVVSAGTVRIDAENRSKNLVHEVIVTPWSDRLLPHDNAGQRVIESRIKILGEVDDLKPGAHGSVTVNLAPGAYLLFCNQPSHYRAGMWTRVVAGR